MKREFLRFAANSRVPTLVRSGRKAALCLVRSPESPESGQEANIVLGYAINSKTHPFPRSFRRRHAHGLGYD